MAAWAVTVGPTENTSLRILLLLRVNRATGQWPVLPDPSPGSSVGPAAAAAGPFAVECQ